MACSNLEELYLSHSQGIERFVIPQRLTKDLPVQFSKLHTLHLSRSPSLTIFNIEALELKVLKVDNNPRLKKGILEAPGCEVISENSPLRLELGALSLEKFLKELPLGNFFFQNNQGLARLEKGFEEIPDSARQEILLKALVQHRYEVLNLSHCAVLTDEILADFLKRSQETLKTLTLRHCPLLTQKVIPLIMACSNLEELYLSHSQGIEQFVIPQRLTKDLPVQFS